LYLKEIGAQLETKFGKGGMKLLIKNISKISTYSIQACPSTYGCSTISLHTPGYLSTLLPNALKNAKEGNFNKDTLNHMC
jgi:phage protein D